MSLEEKLASLTIAVEALVDSNQHLASTLRQCFTGPDAAGRAIGNKTAATQTTEPAPAPAPAQEVKRGPGRPRVNKGEPPASPLEQASSAPSTTPAPSSEESSPAGIATSEGTYADLQGLVPAVAEKHGRSKAVALFASLGVANGKELQEKHPKSIPAAVALFRAALGE